MLRLNDSGPLHLKMKGTCLFDKWKSVISDTGDTLVLHRYLTRFLRSSSVPGLRAVESAGCPVSEK